MVRSGICRDQSLSSVSASSTDGVYPSNVKQEPRDMEISIISLNPLISSIKGESLESERAAVDDSQSPPNQSGPGKSTTKNLLCWEMPDHTLRNDSSVQNVTEQWLPRLTY